MYGSTAHPRSRGEHVIMDELREHKDGSSPLTRGAPFLTFRLWARSRLIPAHAGSTIDRIARLSTRRAHPRSRGEHGLAAFIHERR